tara:strand:- start:4 stop:255 length:252 start_codon:yes stop_codon:yes gene_type:complete
MKKITTRNIIKLIFLILLVSFSTGCIKNTGSTEVGVRVKKLGLFGNRGIEQKVYSPGSTYFFLPYANDWFTFDHLEFYGLRTH